MAITKIWPVKDNLSRVYRYISNEEKTTEEISDGLNEVLTYTTHGYKTNEKEYITGIEYEPWHFRYVGKEAATYIMEQGICLEEYIDGQ